MSVGCTTDIDGLNLFCTMFKTTVVVVSDNHRYDFRKVQSWLKVNKSGFLSQ